MTAAPAMTVVWRLAAATTLIVLAFGQRMISKFDESLVSARKAVTYAEELGDPAERGMEP